jgi:hypothetical protein
VALQKIWVRELLQTVTTHCQQIVDQRLYSFLLTIGQSPQFAKLVGTAFDAKEIPKFVSDFSDSDALSHLMSNGLERALKQWKTDPNAMQPQVGATVTAMAGFAKKLQEVCYQLDVIQHARLT